MLDDKLLFADTLLLDCAPVCWREALMLHFLSSRVFGLFTVLAQMGMCLKAAASANMRKQCGHFTVEYIDERV